MEEVHTDVLLSHADAFLEKPIKPQRLIAVATTLIGSRPGITAAPHRQDPPQCTVKLC
jgi:hypothetical protein